MGSVGNPGEGVVAGHGPGTREFDESWKNCSIAGLPVKGLIVFSVEYQADAGQPLTVVGQAALPPTSLNG